MASSYRIRITDTLQPAQDRVNRQIHGNARRHFEVPDSAPDMIVFQPHTRPSDRARDPATARHLGRTRTINTSVTTTRASRNSFSSIYLSAMSTTNQPARFTTSTGSLYRQAAVRTILWPVLTGLLLVTASCGDLQDPASGAQGASPTQPPVTPASEQQTGETATPGADASPFPAEPAPSLPSPETALFPTEMPSGPPSQALTGEKPETQPVTFEWNPSPSGDAIGYKILVTTMSATTQYTFQTGPETRLTVDLPKGESYYATLFAFNSAGQSPRTDYLRFDLF